MLRIRYNNSRLKSVVGDALPQSLRRADDAKGTTVDAAGLQTAESLRETQGDSLAQF